MQSQSVHRIAATALIAAIYAALTMTLGFMSYNTVQFRVAEALCILPFFFPWTTWGLVLGCLIANLLSPVGPADVIFGTVATLLACLATAALGRGDRRSWVRNVLGCLMPVIFNAAIVGALIAWFEVGGLGGPAFWTAFAVNAASVGFGELVVMLVLGLPLMRWLPQSRFYVRLAVQ